MSRTRAEAVGGAAAGMTLVEVTMVLALAVPLLLVVGSATKAVVGSFDATDRAARVTDVVLRTESALDRAARGGALHTLQTVATRNDVRAGRAAAVGDWFDMPEGQSRGQVAFSALVGDGDVALQVPAAPVRIEFVLDPRERADGRDNDGDGLVDEGAVRLLQDGRELTLLADVERCTFTREGRSLQVDLGFARRRQDRQWQRLSLRQTLLLHNP